MSREAAFSRPRLVVVNEDSVEVQASMPATPSVALIPIDQTQSSLIADFAFELGRALAAQTARTGAVVFADGATIPKARMRLARTAPRGPLSGLRLDPVHEREGVMFFGFDREAAVRAVVRGQMPQLTICDRGQSAPTQTNATVVVVQSGARAEYVELLRGELSAQQQCPVHVVELDGTGARARSLIASRSPSPMRAQAWALAAELVLPA